MPRIRRLAAVFAGVVLLAACGSGSDAPTGDGAAPSPATDTTSTTTSPSTTAAPVSTTTAPTTAPTTTSPSTTVPPATPGPVAAASTPEGLASRIVATEQLTRDPNADPAAVPAAAFELQQRYRQLGRTPEWDDAVLAAAPEELRSAISAHAAARREFRGMHSELSDTLPAWRIVEPVPAAELLAHYQEAEAEFGVPWEVLASVNLVETGMGRIRGTSTAGAQGPMQFMPATWDAFGAGGDIDDTHDAIMGAARYLAHNGGGRGDIDTALWNYNHSWRYVAGVKHYASVLTEDPAAFTGLYHWQVVYASTSGDVWLPAGFEQAERTLVADHLAVSPSHHLGTATD